MVKGYLYGFEPALCRPGSRSGLSRMMPRPARPARPVSAW